MAKIIRFDPSLRQQKEVEAPHPCDHKDVVAFTASRTVHCETCGIELDTFDVLLELLKGYVPPGDRRHEQEKFDRESARRLQKNFSKKL